MNLPVPAQNMLTFDEIIRQADVLAASRIIPRSYQKAPADIIAAALAGQGFGWDVMTSLRNYHVIEGTATLRPEAMLGLVRRAGHSVGIATSPNEEGHGRTVFAHGQRADTGDQHTARFSEEDAKRAGLAGKKNWQQYLDSMLTWRAVSQLCRVLFPDVVLGAGYVPEEMGADVDVTGAPNDEDPFAVITLPVAEAKRQVLDAFEGDKDAAREWWADFIGDEAVTEEELEELIAGITPGSVFVSLTAPADDSPVVDAEEVG